MLDIKLVRENPDLVKANIKKKFQDKKLPLVDEVIDLDKKNRAAITEVEALRAKVKRKKPNKFGPKAARLAIKLPLWKPNRKCCRPKFVPA